MTEILNGNVLAKTIRSKAKSRIKKMKFPPGLAVLLVGENEASALYVRLKEEAAKDVGIYIEKFAYSADVKDSELVKKIEELNVRDDINGILVQMPLPEQNADVVAGAISHLKDVDGFHPENRRLLLANTPNLVPPVSLAIMRLLQATRRSLNGKHAVIVGNSEIFAEPLIELLQDTGVTAAFVRRDVEGLAAITRAADILVVAVGEAAFLTRDMVKESAIVIDVGTTKIGRKTVGDAAPELEGYAGFVSPVPGGVGPLTIAYLLYNVIKAMEVQKRLRGESD